MQHTGDDLTVVGEYFLADLLGVTNIKVGGFLEIEVTLAFLEHGRNLTSSDRNSASDSVLCRPNVFTHIVKHSLVVSGRSLKHLANYYLN